jgi:hypothetical protein
MKRGAFKALLTRNKRHRNPEKAVLRLVVNNPPALAEIAEAA